VNEASSDPPSEQRFSDAVEGRLDRLYRERPDGFVAARDELAGELRDEGDREAAARVRRLRRPSSAAWLINRLGADDPQRVRRLADAADRVAEAQRRVLEEGADPGELRDAAAGEREQLDGLVDAARRLASDPEVRISESVIDRVAQTLQAVGADPQLRERVLRRRLEKEATVATVGLPAAASPRPRPRRRERSSAREVERARRELDRLRERLRTAEARRDEHEGAVHEAEEALGDARARLTQSKREARELERQVSKAERQLPG
jgi:hypothetical protein